MPTLPESCIKNGKRMTQKRPKPIIPQVFPEINGTYTILLLLLATSIRFITFEVKSDEGTSKVCSLTILPANLSSSLSKVSSFIALNYFRFQIFLQNRSQFFSAPIKFHFYIGFR